MRLKLTGVFVVMLSLVSAMLVSGCAQAVKSDAPQWRTSFDAFLKAIDELPLTEVPFCKIEAGEVTGQRVSSESAIMKRFGGKVEFEGTFQGIYTEERLLSPQQKREKIDISMAWPSGLGQNTYWKLHLYPKSGSLKEWRAIKPGATVKFRAVVTGITLYYPPLPGTHLHAFSILLEEGEIVSK
jgi:hypothetical protein